MHKHVHRDTMSANGSSAERKQQKRKPIVTVHSVISAKRKVYGIRELVKWILVEH